MMHVEVTGPRVVLTHVRTYSIQREEANQGVISECLKYKHDFFFLSWLSDRNRMKKTRLRE